MKEFTVNSNTDDYQFYMRGALNESELIRLIRLRPEDDYNSDPDTDEKAVNFLAEFLDVSNLKVFFLWASSSTEKSTPLRFKKFSLASKKAFQNYKIESHEVFLGPGNSRLVSSVLLGGHNKKKLPVDVLHSSIGLFFISDQEKCLEISDKIISKEYSSSAFDIRAILNLPSAGIDFCLMRYFPADNGRDESICLIGKKYSIVLQESAKALCISALRCMGKAK